MLRLTKLALGTADQPIREVRFRGTLGESYVDSTPEQMSQMVHEFLNVEDTPGPRGEVTRKVKRGKRKKLPSVGELGLEDATGFGEDQALQGHRGGARHHAARALPGAADDGLDLRRAAARVQDARDRRAPYGAYRMVLQTPKIGEYYGLQGTTWRNPPILEGVTETRTIGKRTYELVRDGDRVKLVAWRTPKAVYWISNTLLLTLSEKQMMAIARSVQGV